MDYFEHHTFAYHFKSSLFFLENAEKSLEGQHYNLVSSVLFSALALEAFINHLSSFEERFEEWDINKKPTLKQKIDRLTLTMEKRINYSENPFSHISNLKRIRDEIVHGRSRLIQKKVRKPPNNSSAALKNLSSPIDKECTLKKAKMYNHAVKEIIENINQNSQNKIPKSSLWSLGSGSYQRK